MVAFLQYLSELHNTVWIKMLAACLLGTAIGLERQWRQRHSAGMTTHAVVAMGAAAFTLLPGLLQQTTGDPTRIAAQVVSGIGFLGAGLILRDGISVKGLSAAATVWATGAVGVLAGFGYLTVAVEVTAFILISHIVLFHLARWIERIRPQPKLAERNYSIKIKCSSVDEVHVRSRLLMLLGSNSLGLRGIESHDIEGYSDVEVDAIVYSNREQDDVVETIVSDLAHSPHVFSAGWTSSLQNE